jgi:hypothetical protein
MTLAPSWEDMEEVRKDRGIRDSRQELLVALADHVQSPTHATWEALLGSAGRLDELEGRILGISWAERVGPLGESLMAGDLKAWTAFVVEIMGHGAGMFGFGGGARLKALSPFKDRALVVYRGGFVAGELGGLFEEALGRVGMGRNPDASYLLAVGPGAVDLTGATVEMIAN